MDAEGWDAILTLAGELTLHSFRCSFYDERRGRRRTEKNDLDIVRELRKIRKEVPIERAYDFSFTKKPDSELTQAGWNPQKLSRVGALQVSA
jgi:hypothetical protein